MSARCLQRANRAEESALLRFRGSQKDMALKKGLTPCSSGSRFLVATRALIHPSNPKSGLLETPVESRHSLTLLGMTIMECGCYSD
jgi:hypothetical protein